jgi:hypothetical protein
VPHPRPATDPVFELAADPFDITPPGPDESRTPAPPSRTRKILLGSLLAVAVAGVAVIGVASWQIASQKDATLVAPPEVAGLRLDQSDDGTSTADYLQNALSAGVDVDKAVAGVYTAPDGQDILFFGGTTLIWTPEHDLDAAFALIDDAQGAVTGLHDVPAGHFGGTMKCGTTKTEDGEMPVCGWADHGSLALAMFPKRTEAESATLLRELRDAAQSRS